MTSRLLGGGSARTLVRGHRARGGPRVLRLVAMLSVLIVATADLPSAGAGPGGTSARRAGVRSRPNIVLVMTDDQRWDSVWAMPRVQSDLARHGVTFTNGYVVNPLCCPSRATMLTGQYSHSTGVYTNHAPFGGFSAFDDTSTIATWLDDAGYRTGFVGKYLNQYKNAAPRGYVPPGWQRWVAMAENNGSYYDYDLNVDGRIRHLGNEPDDYSTDVLARYAESFVRSSQRPFFLFVAFNAPHAMAIPADRHADAFSDLDTFRPPSYNEEDLSDKPTWTQSRQRLEGEPQVRADAFRRDQFRTLLAVDEAVGRIAAALRETRKLQKTLIVFTSDNGMLYGEHRVRGKESPYEEAIRVPFIVRYDPLTDETREDGHLVLNLDLAPTFAAAAGVEAPGAEGRSFLHLLRDPATQWRSQFLVEHVPGDTDVPSYCALHSRTAVYVLYATGEEEMYDLVKDPFEMSNISSREEAGEIRAQMRSRLDAECQPRPPGFPDEPT